MQPGLNSRQRALLASNSKKEHQENIPHSFIKDSQIVNTIQNNNKGIDRVLSQDDAQKKHLAS